MDKSTCGYWIKWTPHHRRNICGRNIHGHNNNASITHIWIFPYPKSTVWYCSIGISPFYPISNRFRYQYLKKQLSPISDALTHIADFSIDMWQICTNYWLKNKSHKSKDVEIWATAPSNSGNITLSPRYIPFPILIPTSAHLWLYCNYEPQTQHYVN